MTPFLLFTGTVLLLALEGKLLLDIVVGGVLHERERWALGYLMGAFVNVLLVFALTVMKISLGFWVVYGVHAVAVGGLWFVQKRCKGTAPTKGCSMKSNFQLTTYNFPLQKLLLTLLILSLTIKLLYGFSHAAVFPTFYYDSLSQWNLRAKVSYEDRMMAFDRDERRGVSKPQYPILLHSLQITSMLPQKEWRDPVANMSTFLLTIAVFTGLFFILQRLFGMLCSVLTISVLLMIPLVAFHLGQAYADLHVIEYGLLSALFLYLSVQKRSACSEQSSFLVLSALFCAAAAWVKQEGLFFGVLPWMVIVSFVFWPHRNPRSLWSLSAILLGFVWILYLLTQDLPLGAHGGDFQLGWHPEAIPFALKALFAFGSFGIFWYVVSTLMMVILWSNREGSGGATWTRSVFTWGLITLMEALAIFLFTPNVIYLLNNQTFHRTLLLPLCFFVLGCMLFLCETFHHGGYRGSSPGATPGGSAAASAIPR
jgi:hypothetical protein